MKPPIKTPATTHYCEVCGVAYYTLSGTQKWCVECEPEASRISNLKQRAKQRAKAKRRKLAQITRPRFGIFGEIQV
jgi:hypothetical protein